MDTEKNAMFKCPECGKELDYVHVYSQCYQKADLDGNKITDYGSTEEILETQGIECPWCSADIMNLIEQ